MNEFNMVSVGELNRIEGGGFWGDLENGVKDIGHAIQNAAKDIVNGIENKVGTIINGVGGGVQLLRYALC
jgi:hypothetical protein